MWDKLEQVEQRYLELEKEMAEPEAIADHERLAKLARDHSELEEIVIPYREALIVRNNLEQSREELKGESDEELREMLKQDINDLEPRLVEMEENLKRLITPKDPNDRKDCIIEVRAGAGGDEAALFAGELMEM